MRTEYTEFEILIVDGVRENLQLLDNFLSAQGYKIRVAINGKIALMSVDAKKPDLILLDLNMPVMDGHEVAKKLKESDDTFSIPIIFISASNDIEDKVNAFRSGGVDYITKPFANEEVLARVSMHLQLNEYKHKLEDKVTDGLSKISRLNEQLELTQNEIIMTMAAIAEERSDETGQHVKRVAEYAYLLAKLANLSENSCALIHKASAMHDVGKVGIPDSILHKKGPLTSDEWQIMQRHTLKGNQIFEHSTRPVLIMAGIIAVEHHERWDGKGYPYGLKDEEINIAGRIVMVCDVFDALSHTRCYKEAWSVEETISYIANNKGTMFDPNLVDIFLENIKQFIDIRSRYTE